MSDGWIEVTGRRSFKQRNNRKNYKNNLKETDSDPDETKINQNFEKIKKEIQNVYENSQSFLFNLISRIKRSLKSENVCLYALGCGTIENTSMVLAKSCLYQWVLCIILIKVLKISNVHIFDPLMTKNDYIVWNKLLESNYDFKENFNFLNDFDSLSLDSSRQLVSESSSSLSTSSSQSNSTHVLLWMIHCEKFLYKDVLEGILDNKCPLSISKSLTNQSNSSSLTSSSSNNQSNCNSNSSSNSSSNSNCDSSSSYQSNSNSDSLYGHQYNSSISDSNHPESFSLEHTTLVGNSLSEYTLDDLCFKDTFNLVENSLLPFEIHNQSFNDTFITTFNRNSN